MKNLVDNEKEELVCLTETWLTKHEPKFKNYKCEWKHRLDCSGGGLVILIKKNLQYKIINLIPFHNGVLEDQAMDLHLEDSTKLSVFNYYIPNKDVTLIEFQHYLKQLQQQHIMVCESGAEETLRHFLEDCRGLGGIREIYGIREADEVEELLLFSDQDKKKIEKRKKYLEDLWKERKRQVQLRCEGVAMCEEGVKKEELASPSAVAKARLGTASDLICCWQHCKDTQGNIMWGNLKNSFRLLGDVFALRLCVCAN